MPPRLPSGPPTPTRGLGDRVARRAGHGDRERADGARDQLGPLSRARPDRRISDELMYERLANAQTYTAMLLRKTAK
jgi:hypothetical protein